LRIRANQGHSIKVDLELVPKTPPAELFHGTATRFLDSIKNEGLKPGQRQHVHLSTNVDTANMVGQRYGKPVILKIDSASMFKQGFTFYLSENNVWLIEHVPVEYLTIPG
jgi:putative RNA 2'-phosphotransferase